MLFLLIASCGKEVSIDKLVSRDGIMYEKDFNTHTPFTGIAIDEEYRRIYKESYVNGILHGLTEGFSEGCLDFQVSYFMGLKEGEEISYYSCGVLSYRANYKEGEYHGPYEDYYENGNLRFKGHYWADRLDGLAQSFFEDGTLESETTYEFGKVIKNKKYNQDGTLWSFETASFDEILDIGESVYVKNCAACHQVNLEGVPGIFPSLNESDFKDKYRIMSSIIYGVRGAAMPSFKKQLSPEDINSVINYIAFKAHQNKSIELEVPYLDPQDSDFINMMK